MAIIAPRLNAGRAFTQPDFPENSGGYEFIDLMKHAQLPLIATDNSVHYDPSQVDSNGYPTVLLGASNGAYTITFASPNRPGNYVIIWKGANTTIGLNMGYVPVSGSFTADAGGSGRFVFTMGDPRFVIQINSLGVSDLHIFHADDEADFNAGFISGSKVRQRIKQGQVPVWRVLNWMNANFSNVTTWATRKPVNYVSYAGPEFRNSIYAGSTTNTGLNYAANLGSGGPVDKTMITVKFNATAVNPETTVTITNGTPGQINWTGHNTNANDPIMFGFRSNLPSGMDAGLIYYVKTVVNANTITVSATQGGAAINMSGASSNVTVAACCTFTLNGAASSSGIPIRGAGGGLAASDNNNNTAPVNGAIGTLVCDADLQCWLLSGGNVGFGDIGIDNGVPPEVIIQWCNEVGCSPYFTAPYLSLDPMTDYTKQLATLCAASCAFWAVPIFEGYNEQWNFITPGTIYAMYKGHAHWSNFLNSVSHDWTGKTVSTMGQDIASVYGPPDGAKYHVLVGVQTATTPTNSNARLTAASYVAQGAPPQSGYTKTAASDHATHICIATYFASASDVNAATTAWLAAGTAAAKQAVVDAFLDDPTLGCPPGLVSLGTIYSGWATWARGFTNSAGRSIGMQGYEGGGPAQDYNSGGVSNHDQFCYACKFGTNAQKYYVQNANNFFAAGGVLHPDFQAFGPTPSSNQWSSLEDIYQADTPRWLAIVQLNALLVITINNATLDRKSAEVAYAKYAAEEALKEFGRGNGTVTSGTILGVSAAGVANTSLGSWTYTPAASNP